MPLPIQIVADCRDPQALASFRAAALHREVEDNSDRVQWAIEQEFIHEEDSVNCDGRLFFADLAACIDPTGASPRILFQKVPEPKTVKNRLHIDIHVGGENYDVEVSRLEALGASKVEHVRVEYGAHWVVMNDPEGNEFCLT